jgi:hypothetical protein
MIRENSTKICEVCKEVFGPWRHETDGSWKNRITCSDHCRDVRRAIQRAKERAKVKCRKTPIDKEKLLLKDKKPGHYIVKSKILDAFIYGKPTIINDEETV